VSGSWDGTARVWDLSTGTCVSVLEGHENGVNVCALDDGTIVTTSTGEQVNNKVENYKVSCYSSTAVICVMYDCSSEFGTGAVGIA
jgi:WD40 repeat protein